MSPLHASTRDPVGPPPRGAFGGITMAEAADAMRVLAGLPMLRSKCSTCGAGYRPDPRDEQQCAYCGGGEFR